MHRCYQSVLPTHNKLLQKRWDNKYYDEHRKLIRSAAPMVDTKPPRTYMHLHLKLKKLQLQEERLATIEHDNWLLLERIVRTMRTRGTVDNCNCYEYKSLNREKRMRELLRVTRENQEILKRITERKPEYDHSRWQQDWVENQRFMGNIAAYPKDWWKERDEAAASARSVKSSGKSRRSHSKAKSANKKAEKPAKEDTTIKEEDEEEEKGEEKVEKEKKEEEKKEEANAPKKKKEEEEKKEEEKRDEEEEKGQEMVEEQEREEQKEEEEE